MLCTSKLSNAARACVVGVGAVSAVAASAAEFRSAWPKDIERVWAGPEYWTNRLQDWRVANGRLECVTSGGDRNVHLLTHQLGARRGDLRMRVRLGKLTDRQPGPGWVGFRVGARGQWNDYRDSARRGQGLDVGVTTDGQLFIGTPTVEPALPHRGIPRKGWTIHHVTSQETDGADNKATNAFDGRPGTIWHSQYVKRRGAYPYEFQIDLGRSVEVCGFCYLGRQDKQIGRIKDYEFYVSADGRDWGQPVSAGRFPDSAALQEVTFQAKAGRYVRLLAKSGVVDRPACVIAELFVLDPATRRPQRRPASPQPAKALPLDGLELRLAAEPQGDRYALRLTAHDANGTELSRQARLVTAGQLLGNLALVCHAARGARRGDAAGGNVRFWFADWSVSGSKVEAHPEHAFGPILWCQHTLSRGVLKLTAQMPPIGEKEAQTVRLEIEKGGKWTQVAETTIHKLARTATFRVTDWDSSRDTPYRAAYAMTLPDGSREDRYWAGTIRHDPVDKPTIVVAAFTGNADYAFPNLDLVRHVTIHDPDVLFFSGDNIYENVGGYGCQRSPLDQATLGYLRKWYFFGWAFRELMCGRPTISIPDDHDVYQGNLWGHGGRKCPGGINTGGYAMPPEWVKMVERTQTSNLPDPYDPTPIEQGIGVYYTDMVYARVSFAIVEDRKFKTGPEGLVPRTKSGRSDHVVDPTFDTRTADVPGAKLLGDRQLRFLRQWATDWRGADMKCALSQTTFCNVATLHGGGLQRLIADYDSNGWPQTGRNKAVDALRRGFAFHIGGDQHLATIVHHGIDGWNDATWSFAVPSICNFYPRAWVPLKPAHNWTKGMIDHTGEFRDPFGNFITVWAHTNPRKMGREPAAIHDKMPGYGLVRFHKDTRRITIECWPLFADPRDPRTGGQYEGWPKTIDQLDCYARDAAAWLPTLEIEGMTDPVVQVIDEATGEVVYTLRIKGTRFRPKVFNRGTHTVRLGEQPDRMRTLRGIRALPADRREQLEVRF